MDGHDEEDVAQEELQRLPIVVLEDHLDDGGLLLDDLEQAVQNACKVQIVVLGCARVEL